MNSHDVLITNTALKFSLLGLFGLVAWVAAFYGAVLRTNRRTRLTSRQRWVWLIVANLMSLGGLLTGLILTGITPGDMVRAATLWWQVPIYGQAMAIMYWFLLVWPLANLTVVPTIVRSNRKDRQEAIVMNGLAA